MPRRNPDVFGYLGASLKGMATLPRPRALPAVRLSEFHTSLNLDACTSLVVRRLVPQRSLPPCGGGTGRGSQQAPNSRLQAARSAFLVAVFRNIAGIAVVLVRQELARHGDLHAVALRIRQPL